MINFNIEHMDEFNTFCSLMDMPFDLLLKEYAHLCALLKFYKYGIGSKNLFELSPIFCTIDDWVSMYQSVIAERITVDVLGEDVREML